jgi:hypothetical protein
MSKSSQEWRSKLKKPAGGAGESAGQGAVANGAAAAAESDGILRLSAETVVRGIIFHMLEEGLAREVAADSVEKTLRRMRRRDLRPTVRHTAWLAMTNHDRLEWLLAESRTVPLIHPNDVVSLDGRDEE